MFSLLYFPLILATCAVARSTPHDEIRSNGDLEERASNNFYFCSYDDCRWYCPSPNTDSRIDPDDCSHIANIINLNKNNITVDPNIGSTWEYDWKSCKLSMASNIVLKVCPAMVAGLMNAGIVECEGQRVACEDSDKMWAIEFEHS